jgi:hypothetical protein
MHTSAEPQRDGVREAGADGRSDGVNVVGDDVDGCTHQPSRSGMEYVPLLSLQIFFDGPGGFAQELRALQVNPNKCM